MKTYKEFVNEAKSDMYKKYDGFKVLNMKTKKSRIYPYQKGKDSRDVEAAAIRDEAKNSGQPVSDFMIHGFIAKGEMNK